MNIDIKEATESKSKLVAFALPESWYDELKREADSEMMSVSNLIRILIYKGCLKDRLERKDG
jgi:hypothetical protein